MSPARPESQPPDSGRSTATSPAQGLETLFARRRPKTGHRPAYPIYEALAASLRRGDIHVGAMRPTNYYRSAFHVASGAVALACIQHVLPPEGLIWVSGGFAAFCWTAETVRRFSPTINHCLMAFFGPMAHAHEHYRVNSATWYATALAVLALTTTPLTASLAVVVLAMGDPVAGLIGRRFGKTKIRANRSLEGSLAFVAAACLSGFAVLSVYYPALHWQTALSLAFISAVAGMLAELYSRWLDDNFTIPVAAGLAANLAASFLL